MGSGPALEFQKKLVGLHLQLHSLTTGNKILNQGSNKIPQIPEILIVDSDTKVKELNLGIETNVKLVTQIESDGELGRLVKSGTPVTWIIPVQSDGHIYPQTEWGLLIGSNLSKPASNVRLGYMDIKSTIDDSKESRPRKKQKVDEDESSLSESVPTAVETATASTQAVLALIRVVWSMSMYDHYLELRKQSPNSGTSMIPLPPLVTKNQLYSFVPQVVVDTGLEVSRSKNLTRILSLPSAPDDFVVILSNEYAAVLNSIPKLNSSAKSLSPLLQKFSTLLSQTPTHTISKSALVSGLFPSHDKKSSPMRRKSARAVQSLSLDIESTLNSLIEVGTLIQTSSNVYVLSAPGLGAVSTELSRGRSKVIQIIRRQTFREILISNLTEKLGNDRLRETLDWVLRDMIGGGIVHLTDVSGGRKLLRLV